MRKAITILKNPNKSEIEHAIEFNFYDVVRMMSTIGLKGTAYEETDQFFRYSSGVPFFLFNTVINSQISPEIVNQKIEENITFFDKMQVPFVWMIGPSSRPKNLGELLIKNGFIIEKQPGMAFDLKDLNTDIDPLTQIEIIKIDNIEKFNVWNDVVLTGFELPKEILSDFFQKAFSYMLLRENSSASAFLAYYEKEPVASSLVCYEAGVAGIYNVTTLEDVRGKGIGTAITLAPLIEAKNLGYEIAILHSSEMGYNTYKKMGFKEYCTIEMYIWQPE
ncbi:MAG: GNAT family N-acetyltransferase [Promethearchaeota archaeon]